MVDLQKVVVCHNVLPQDMATLLGNAQDQGLHIQHLLEILQHQPRASMKKLRWDDTFGVAKCGIHPQMRLGHCSS